MVLPVGGFDETRMVERGRGGGEHESATLEVRGGGGGGGGTGTHAAATAASDVVVTSAPPAAVVISVPFASSEDDRNLQTTVSITLMYWRYRILLDWISEYAVRLIYSSSPIQLLFPI